MQQFKIKIIFVVALVFYCLLCYSFLMNKYIEQIKKEIQEQKEKEYIEMINLEAIKALIKINKISFTIEN